MTIEEVETATLVVPTINPWANWSAQAIASASKCSLSAVQEHFPRIVTQMALCTINSPNVQIGIIGTTAIEGASTFTPVREGCYLGEPEPAETHRKTLPYYPYYGRGHIQLTHEKNYERYGQRVAELWRRAPAEFDLVATPDIALDPDVAAGVISLYFRDTRALPSTSYPEGYTLIQACEERDWEWVRRLVYGGADPAGAQRISQIATDLGPAGGGGIVAGGPVYDSGTPAISQNDQWSCAPTSARWCLTAYGRQPQESWVENSMIMDGVVSTNQGLLNAAGVEMANWFNRHYGEFGYVASNNALVSFDEVAEEAGTGKHPLMIGGRNWYHWSGVRGFDGTKIMLANPASGYAGITQTLSREQFNYLGSFSMVRLTHPGSEAQPPIPPVEPTDPFAPWAGKVGSGLIEMMAQDNTLPAQRRSTWLPLGEPPPSDIESCYGQNGTLYYWLMTVGRGHRTRPD